MLTRNKIEEMIRKSGALLEGHFELTSGFHSAKYFQCALLLQDPKRCALLAKELANKFRTAKGLSGGAALKVDVVIGPAMGGIVLAYETARQMGCRSIFSEWKDGRMILRRGFSITRGERVLVVEDVVTTGGSVKEVIMLAEAKGAEVIGVGAIVDRSQCEVNFGKIKFASLIRLEIQTFAARECLLCKKGIEFSKPGSRQEAIPL